MRRAKRILTKIPKEINQEYEIHFLQFLGQLVVKILVPESMEDNNNSKKAN